ncbi:MAG: DUF4012 domain-containing protein [Aeromicrobium sp.]
MASRRRSHKPRSMRQRLEDIWDNPRQRALAIVGLLVMAAGLLFTWEAFRAYGSIQEAEVRAGILQDDIVEGDVDAAVKSYERLDASTSRAHNSTNGPLWWLGAQVPILGRNVDAVRTVAREIDQVVDEVLPGVVEVADKVRLETYRPKDGRFDLEAVAEAAPVMVKADQVLTAASRDVASIDPDGLLGPLQTPMRQLQARFLSTAVAASAADDAAKLLPGMIGADGTERQYLLLIMNNAEVRSLSGMPGSFAVINAKNGKLTMGRQGGILDVRPLPKSPPGAKLSEDEQLLFQSSITMDIRNTAIHTDFPRTAELAAAIAGKRWKAKFDGVIGVDPVTLGYMLNGLGPVDVGDDVTLTSRNAVAQMLNGVYLKYPIDVVKQDAIFENAARRIFDATVAGTGNSVSVIRALVRGVSERRLMLWSRHDDEQKRIRTTDIANLFQSGGRPQVGVYVNDAGSAKMSYYLTMGTVVRSEQCFDGFSQELRSTTTLVSNAPTNTKALPLSIVGPPRLRRGTPGNIQLGVMIAGPKGGTIESMTVDGQPAPIGAARYQGRPVAKVARELPPGRSSVILTTMRTAAASPGDPELRTTPGVRPNADAAGASACE